jgi:hypothetical protein
MRNADASEPSSSNGKPRPALKSTPIEIPVIDFSTPTGDEMVEVRKGFGLGDVGGSSPASRSDL